MELSSFYSNPACPVFRLWAMQGLLASSQPHQLFLAVSPQNMKMRLLWYPLKKAPGLLGKHGLKTRAARLISKIITLV